MKKWKEIKDKPITWGGYGKLCGIIYVISLVITAIWCAAIWWNEIVDWVDETFHELTWRFHKLKSKLRKGEP